LIGSPQEIYNQGRCIQRHRALDRTFDEMAKDMIRSRHTVKVRGIAADDEGGPLAPQVPLQQMSLPHAEQ
jgi:hypothetical protein